MIRSLVCAWTLLLGAGLATNAHGAEALLRNDTLPTDGGAFRVSAGVVFGDYQGALVLLPAPTAPLPANLIAIDVLYVPESGGGVQEPFDLDIWSVPDGGPGAVTGHGDLYSTSTLSVSVALSTSTAALNRYTLPTPLSVAAPVVVRLRHSYDNATFPYAGTIALDQGPVVVGANWFDAALAGGIHSIDLPDAGIPDENWVIRGVLDVDAGPTTTTSSSTAGSTGASGSSSGTTGGASAGSTGGTSSGSGSAGVTSGTSGGGPTLSSVAPAQAYSADTTALTLVGSNFAFGAQALVGPAALSDVTLRSPAVLSGTLRPGTPPGTYDVTVINPDGRQAKLSGAFVVRPGSNPSASGGSAGASGSTGGSGGTKGAGCSCGSGGDGLLLPLLLLALARPNRRRPGSVHSA